MEKNNSIRFNTLLIFFIVLLVPEICQAQDNLRLPYYDTGVFNPNRGPVTVKYNILKDADEVEVLVENFQGSIVERLNFVDLRAGSLEFIWKGIDDSGKRLAEGRYVFDITVRFTDNTTETDKIEVRISATVEEETLTAPDPLFSKKYLYKENGYLPTSWPKNTEGKENDFEDFEHRTNVSENNRMVDAVFAYRRTKDGEADYDASHAIAEQRWEKGKIKGVFRQGLGSLDDPMKLFSDFRTERKKAGARLDHTIGWLNVNALGFSAEGNVESEEQGLAGRITLGSTDGWRIGANYTHRRAVPDYETEDAASYAVSGDIRIPLYDKVNLLFEYAETEDTEKRKDTGFLVRAEHDSGGLRLSGGYIDLGEHFEAEYANPIREVTKDIRGVEMSIDHIKQKPFGIIKNLATGMRFLALKKNSNDEEINEVDVSLRFGLGKKDTLLFNCLSREEGENKSHSMISSGRHVWDKTWSSGLQTNYTYTDTSYTCRGLFDTTLTKGKSSYRLSLEDIRREDGPADSPYKEIALLLDIDTALWRINLMGRHNRRKTETGNNLFGRLEFFPEFLSRYMINTYMALGEKAAFKTEKQIELGMEGRF